MKNKKTIFLNLTLLFFIAVLSVSAQSSDPSLLNKKITMQMERVPLGIVFAKLIDDYDVMIGFEYSSLDFKHDDFDFAVNPALSEEEILEFRKNNQPVNPNPHPFYPREHWITINVVNESLENVLNSIVKQMKNYEWQVNDGVVNIFPINERDERLEQVLNLNIKNLSLKKGETIGFIVEKIRVLPEITRFADKNSLNFISKWGRTIYTRKRELKDDYNFSNLTFRELLNKITQIKGGGWILRIESRFGDDEKEHLEIDI